MTHYDIRILESLNVLWYPVNLSPNSFNHYGIKSEITDWCKNSLKGKWRYTWKGLEFNHKNDKMLFILRWGHYVL